MDLRAQEFRIPLREPFKIAYDEVTHADEVLVQASADGHTGFGEAGSIPTITGEMPDTIHDQVSRWLATGTRPDDAGIAAGLAFEMAQLDLEARIADVPLCTHLTGAAPTRIESSITIPLVDDDKVEPLTKRLLGEGFSIFKIKAGLEVARDLDRIALVREHVGPKTEIRIDPNQGWSRDDARAALPVLRDLGIDVLEQPLAKDDLKGHAMLRAEDEVPIMLDETVFTAADAQAAIDAAACDRINIKLQKAGAIREGLAIAETAEHADIPCMVGCMIESRVGLLAAAHLVASHDNIQWADLDGCTFLSTEPVTGGPTLIDGAYELTDAPGLGVTAVDAGAPLAPMTA